MMRLMHEGETGSVVGLDTLLPGPHLYALGALAGLDGEVTIIDDRVWLSRPGRDGPDTVRPEESREGAALLVDARVERWMELRVERDVMYSELGDEIARLAKEHDVRAPFPFLIEGEVHELDWHVVDGAKLASIERPTHVDHMRTAQRGWESWADAVLLGFYSTEHHGLFTHRDSDIHIHAVLDDPPLTGHVDGVVIPKGTLVKLPAGR